jgi:hypothetical protein
MRFKMPITLLLAMCSGLYAEQWEFGAAGGSGFTRNLAVSAPSGTASTGFAPGFAASAVLGQEVHPRLSGEVRYTFRDSNLRVSSGGSSVSFSGMSHAVHYDLLIHASDRRSPVRPFLASGAGVRVFRGTGKETAFQPLSQYAILTKTQEHKPMISVGGGVKYSLSSRLLLRVEFRDYITPFPKEVILPSPGAKMSGWLHDFVPMAGVTFLFE